MGQSARLMKTSLAGHRGWQCGSWALTGQLLANKGLLLHAYRALTFGQLSILILAAAVFGAFSSISSDQVRLNSAPDFLPKNELILDHLPRPTQIRIRTFYVVASENQRSQVVLGLDDGVSIYDSSNRGRFEVLVASTPEEEARVFEFLNSLVTRWNHPEIRLQIVDLREEWLMPE
jgi:hypothetical protein